MTWLFWSARVDYYRLLGLETNIQRTVFKINSKNEELKYMGVLDELILLLKFQRVSI